MYDVVIIGGGPAGLTAGVYASRRSLKNLILTQDIGGQIAKSNVVENYPGVEKITGVELALSLKKQAEKFGSEIKFQQVNNISKKGDYFEIKTNGETFETKAVILAFGKQPTELNVPGEETFKGKGVTYCATCDAPFFKNKTVSVVGGGNSALDAALLASTFADKVYLIHRREEFRGEEILIEKVNSNPKITKVLNEEIAEIIGDTKMRSIKLKSGKIIDSDGVIVEIGFVVNRKIIEGIVDIDEKNQIKINNLQETSEKGIFAAGDLTNTPYKQVVISAAEGAKAALSASVYISSLDGKKVAAIDWH